jgi:hypothetical protein
MTYRGNETISAPIADLAAFLEHVPTETHDEGEQHGPESVPFFLSQVSDSASAAYEKLRSAVDNKEEHFLRRHAIRRVVKRIGWYSADPHLITTTLLRELYRGGYLPKERVSHDVETRVRKTIVAFLQLSNAIRSTGYTTDALLLRGHLLDIVSGAIEDRLYPTYNEEAIVLTLARITLDALDTRAYKTLPEETKHSLVYIASWRSLFGADTSLLVYKLWLMEHPDWEEVDQIEALAIGGKFALFEKRASRLLKHAFGERLVPRMRNLGIAMTVIYELVKRYEGNIGVIALTPNDFDARVREVITEKYRQDITRSHRRAWRALIYIFLTKTLLALAVESAYLSIWSGNINFLAMGVNILFHPLLLFVITIGLVPPARNNTERLVALIGDIVYGKMPIKITLLPQRWGLMSDIALACYIALLSAMFLGISMLLTRIGFHAIDIGIFFLFLALVVYFGFRIRYAARKMELVGGREGFLRSFVELLALPIVSVGRYLVAKFERLNIVAILLDFFIELPLKLVFQFFDSFSKVLRETKEEIYS